MTGRRQLARTGYVIRSKRRVYDLRGPEVAAASAGPVP